MIQSSAIGDWPLNWLENVAVPQLANEDYANL